MYTVLAFALLFSLAAGAQVAPGASAGSATGQSVPRLVRFSSTLKGQSEGVHGVTFALYKEESGGAPLWLEIQNVTVDAQGRYTVLLGSVYEQGVPADLFSTNEARWLGVQVEGEAEQPRVLLVSVPYALKAADADTVGGLSPSDFLRAAPGAEGTAAGGTGAGNAGPGTAGGRTAAKQSGVKSTVVAQTITTSYVPKFQDGSGTLTNSLMFDSGTGIGIGTTTPGSLLDLSAASPLLRFSGTDSTQSERLGFYDGATLGGFIYYYNASSAVNPKVFQIGGYVSGSQLGFLSAGLERIRVDASGNVGIGTTAPASKLHIHAVAPVLRLSSYDSTQAEQISLYEGLTQGGFLRYNNSASATPKLVQMGGSVAGSQLGLLTAGLERVRVDATGNMGIGTTAPSQKLEVAGNIKATGANGYYFPDASNQIKAGLTDISGGGLQVAQGAGVRTLSLLTSCATDQLLKWNGSAWACAMDITTTGSGGGPVSFSGSNTTSIVSATQTHAGIANPSVATPPPSAVFGRATNTTGFTAGVLGIMDATKGGGVLGIATSSTLVGSGDKAAAVIGVATATTGDARGVEGDVSSPNGIAGHFHNDATSGTVLEASYGPSNSTTVLSVGSSGFTIGVTGQNGQINGNTVVNGNLNVTGSLSKGAGSFKIDDPLDPENKYLYHSFVESPDMMDIYNGVATLDAHGRAWVQMPEWFEALNMDFRYQLTAMGKPEPNLYVAREIKGNRFEISGGRAHGRVSWQVTGIRHDAYANAHRIPVEEAKPAEERGKYLHPELYPQPEPQNASAGSPAGHGPKGN